MTTQLLCNRNTNVYEERSLGIYAHDQPSLSEEEDSKSSTINAVRALVLHHILGRGEVRSYVTAAESSRSYFLRQQIRSQLSHDIWLVAMAVLFISIAESSNYSRSPVAFSTFNIIFEVVSAYGCVGISVGYPNKNNSFCGSWHTISKLILAATALRGRHRGLPVAVDRAVMLPHESIDSAEEEETDTLRRRTGMN